MLILITDRSLTNTTAERERMRDEYGYGYVGQPWWTWEQGTLWSWLTWQPTLKSNLSLTTYTNWFTWPTFPLYVCWPNRVKSWLPKSDRHRAWSHYFSTQHSSSIHKLHSVFQLFKHMCNIQFFNSYVILIFNFKLNTDFQLVFATKTCTKRIFNSKSMQMAMSNWFSRPKTFTKKKNLSTIKNFQNIFQL